MNEQVQARLQELREEYGRGQATLEDLERQTSNVRATMLRISGAIQVLEELLAADAAPEEADTGADAPPPGGRATLSAL